MSEFQGQFNSETFRISSIDRRLTIASSLSFFLLFLFLGVCLAPSQAIAQERVTTAQKRVIKKIGTGIDRAGKLFENNKHKQSAKLIGELAEDLADLVKEEPSPALLAAVQEQHARLQQAREALVAAGQSLSVIAALPEVVIDPDAPVSFTGEIATILNTNCGSCHVRRARGMFNMSTFDNLASGVGGAPVIIAQKPDESRLIEAIEEGSMPPGGDGIPEAQMERLKKWIAEGARFDGEDRNANVATMARSTERPALEIAQPLGNETVSFSIDVAPALMQSCVGCHYEARNTRGGLRVDTFRQFLAGGDSGPLITVGDGENSLLVQRLRATDNTRMPSGRRALDPAVIQKIVTWIDEGARFDGRGGRVNLRDVNAIAVSEAATHEALISMRREGVARNWKKVMSDVKAVNSAGDEVFVVSTEDNIHRQKMVEFGDAIASKIKDELKFANDQPLVKGQISIFMFDRRYDYSEFGKMIETRALPKQWRSHWGYDTVTAYTAVLTPEGTALDDLEPELAQRIAAVAVASLGPDVPEWFADGLGYVVAEKVASDRSAVAAWREQSTEAVASMTSATDFLQGRLANDKSGLVAYAFVKALQDADGKKFDSFLEAVKGGMAFEEAFANAWSATPVDLIRQQFGGGQRNNRQRRNRRGR